MIIKIIATVTLVPAFVTGTKKIWTNPELSVVTKITATLTIIIPLITGVYQIWKKK